MRLFALLALFTLAWHADAEPVDLELVLAMDASASVSYREYLLQAEGTAAAFRDPDVRAAIRSGPYGRIAVTMMLWSDRSLPETDTGWHVLHDDTSIDQFANLVRWFKINENNTPTLGWGGGTYIGAGVMRSLEMLASNGHEGLRKVIDVSGDGPETEFEYATDTKIGPAIATARAQGVTVNGLPIVTSEQPALEEYYRTQVITGPGSFVLPADGFDDFARALREKLLREIPISIGSKGQIPGYH